MSPAGKRAVARIKSFERKITNGLLGKEAAQKIFDNRETIIGIAREELQGAGESVSADGIAMIILACAAVHN